LTSKIAIWEPFFVFKVRAILPERPSFEAKFKVSLDLVGILGLPDGFGLGKQADKIRLIDRKPIAKQTLFTLMHLTLSTLKYP
jgi:hypothetical protein